MLSELGCAGTGVRVCEAIGEHRGALCLAMSLPTLAQDRYDTVDMYVSIGIILRMSEST
jgi:hypothetical protein